MEKDTLIPCSTERSQKVNEVPWDAVPQFSIYSTRPYELEEKKKIQPSLPTYGYMSRQCYTKLEQTESPSGHTWQKKSQNGQSHPCQ